MDNLSKRHLLFGVDDSDAATRAFQWGLDNFYREGDEVHLFHVIPPSSYIVIASDLGMEEMIQDDPEKQKKVEEDAHKMIQSKYAPVLEAQKIPYQIEVVRYNTDSDSVGAAICKRAEQLNAAGVIMAKHNKGRLQEFFVGSVTVYCTHHCTRPVILLHCD